MPRQDSPGVRKKRRLQTAAAVSSLAAERDLAYAQEVIEAEAQAALSLVHVLGSSFSAALAAIDACQGTVVTSGMGKAGLIAQKISATLASTGCPSFFLHPAEALHGDLGRLSHGDVLIAFSNSGDTEEILRLMPPLKRLGVRVIALTGNADSPLARTADIVLPMGKIREACPLGLVPTASTTAMLVLGDALAMTLFKRRGLGRNEFARFHPGGKLGQRLLRVSDVMRKDLRNPLCDRETPLLAVIKVMTETPGRPGAATIVDRKGRLVGIFTDGDLRRLLEGGQFLPERPVWQVMTKHPKTVRETAWVEDGERLLRENRIDNVPVLNDDDEPVGLLDVQDLLMHNVYKVW